MTNSWKLMINSCSYTQWIKDSGNSSNSRYLIFCFTFAIPFFSFEVRKYKDIPRSLHGYGGFSLFPYNILTVYSRFYHEKYYSSVHR